jgi:shikimate kinase
MIVLVVGPSGVGKSTLGEYAEQKIPGCRFYDLDKLVKKRTGKSTGKLLPKIGNDAFLNLCQTEVKKLASECPGKLCIVAVGAGALQSCHVLEWLKIHSTLAITALAREVYERGGARNQERSFEEFKQTEYSPCRIQIYSSADHTLAVDGLSLQQAKEQFVQLIKSIYNQLFPNI